MSLNRPKSGPSTGANHSVSSLVDTRSPITRVRSRSRSQVSISTAATSASNFSGQTSIGEEDETEEELPQAVYHDDEETKLQHKRPSFILAPPRFTLLLQNTGSVARDHVCMQIICPRLYTNFVDGQ